MEKKKRKKSIRSLIRSSIWILNKNSYKYYYCHQELLITKEDEYVFHYLEDVVANHYIKTIKNITNIFYCLSTWLVFFLIIPRINSIIRNTYF